jgi:hypothetical protein
MVPERVILASESGALIVNVWGDLAAQPQPQLPRPRAIVGTLIFYGFLGLLAQLGEGIARFAAASGAVLFLVLLVGNGAKASGAGGRSLIGLLGSTTRLITGRTAATVQAPAGPVGPVG